MSAALYFVLLLRNFTSFLNCSKRPKASNPQIDVQLPLRQGVTFGMFAQHPAENNRNKPGYFSLYIHKSSQYSIVLSLVCF